MKSCKICGAVFSPTNNNQKYCSNECSRIVINEKHRKRYMQKKTQTKKTMTKVCTVCGSLFVLTHSAQTMCSKECVKKKKALRANLYYQNNKTTLKKKELNTEEDKVENNVSFVEQKQEVLFVWGRNAKKFIIKSILGLEIE